MCSNWIIYDKKNVNYKIIQKSVSKKLSKNLLGSSAFLMISDIRNYVFRNFYEIIK